MATVLDCHRQGAAPGQSGASAADSASGASGVANPAAGRRPGALGRILVLALASVLGTLQAQDACAQKVPQEAQKVPQEAKKVPQKAELTLQSYRLPINRNDPAYTKLNLDSNPAIRLHVTFSDGSVSENYAQEDPANVLFDDRTGDPKDLIEVVYWPVDGTKPSGPKFAAQLTSTGNGVGKATLKVSFRNAPGVKTELEKAVEVVSGAR